MPCVVLPCRPRRLISCAPCLVLPVSLVLYSLISPSLFVPCSVYHHVGVLQSGVTVVAVLMSRKSDEANRSVEGWPRHRRPSATYYRRLEPLELETGEGVRLVVGLPGAPWPFDPDPPGRLRLSEVQGRRPLDAGPYLPGPEVGP